MKNEYPFSREHDIPGVILRQNLPAFNRLLNELMGSILYDPQLTLPVARVRLFELLTVVIRSAISLGYDPSPLLSLSESCFNSFSTAASMEALCTQLLHAASALSALLFPSSPQAKDGLAAAEQFIQENYAHKLTLSMAASHAYLSPTYFCKAFRERFGMGYNEYLNRVRMKHAKQLLDISNLSLSSIAAAVGFEDPSYFCKVFKRMEGQTPGEYRLQRGKFDLPEEMEEPLFPKGPLP